MVYRTLVTGVGICGKTTFARQLKGSLLSKFAVQNSDLDYDSDWRIVNISKGIYILQTPHGKDTETMDSIPMASFDRIFYLQIDPKTYWTLLNGRANAWFRMGRLEGEKDTEPGTPEHRKRLDVVINGYASRRERLFLDDRSYFERNPLVRFVDVELVNDELSYRNYDSLLEEVVKEANGEINF